LVPDDPFTLSTGAGTRVSADGGVERVPAMTSPCLAATAAATLAAACLGADGSTPWGTVTALFGGSGVMAAAGVFSWGRYRKSG
jgi:hypothetical protein